MNRFDKALDYFQSDSYDEFKERYPEIGDLYRKMSLVMGEKQLEVIRESLRLASSITDNPYGIVSEPEPFSFVRDVKNFGQLINAAMDKIVDPQEE